MTIDNEPVINIAAEEVDGTAPIVEGTTPPELPIPGMDIFRVVQDEVMRRAEEGWPPSYAFIRMDIIMLVAAANSAPGLMRWVDEAKGLNCMLVPYLPRDGQKPFFLASTYEEASHVLVASFPDDTFTYTSLPSPDNDVQPEITDEEIVETNNG